MPVTVLRRSARAAAAAALALILAPGSRPAAQSAAERPRLLVMVVVDQMRADYLRRLNGRFAGGFRRLLDEGAVFDQAYYPYLNTVTCAGHATIGTGALPKTHGAIMNQWFDRATDRVRTCTADRGFIDIVTTRAPGQRACRRAAMVGTRNAAALWPALVPDSP